MGKVCVDIEQEFVDYEEIDNSKGNMTENILRFRKSFFKGFTFEKMDDVAEHLSLIHI